MDNGLGLLMGFKPEKQVWVGSKQMGETSWPKAQPSFAEPKSKKLDAQLRNLSPTKSNAQPRLAVALIVWQPTQNMSIVNNKGSGCTPEVGCQRKSLS